MENLKKSPGMCSDRPGTTPKRLDLVVSPTCLIEKEREPFGICVRFGGGSERDIQYKSSLADPTILSSRGLSAVLWRTVRLWIFYTANWLILPLVKSAQHRRTVRGPLADCPQCISEVDNFSTELLVKKSHKRRTIRPLPADCPQYQISVSPEIFQISQFQLQFGIIAHIKIQKSQILHENFLKTHMSKY